MATQIKCRLNSNGILGPEKLTILGTPPVKTPIAIGFPANRRRRGGRVAACWSTSPKPRELIKSRSISHALRDLLGVDEISKDQAIRKIWDYARANNLQDPNDKKFMICDKKLKKIFGGKERVRFLEISELITSHLL